MNQRNAAIRQGPPSDHFQLQDCPVLPSQFFTRRSRSIFLGERRLLLAVLEEAIDSYCKSCGRCDRRSQNLHREAEEWIFSDDRSWLLSFQNVCDVLDIEGDSLRERLTTWKSSHLKRKVPSQAGRVYPLRLAV